MRRSRFTAYTDQGPKVILAYTVAQVQRYFEGCGYVVSRIERGDYRTARAQFNPPADGGWKLDRAALAEAIALLGLSLPVKIKQTSHQGGRYGAHSFRPLRGKFFRDPSRDTAAGGMYHHITVKSWLSPEQAGRTLWHELTHAMQAERETAQATTMREQFQGWRFCAARGRGTAYRAKPIEVEAREHEPLNDDLPLAVPA